MSKTREALEAARARLAPHAITCNDEALVEQIDAALREMDEAEPYGFYWETYHVKSGAVVNGGFCRNDPPKAERLSGTLKDFARRVTLLYTTPPDVLAVLKEAKDWIENNGDEFNLPAYRLLARIDKLLGGR